MHLASTHLPQMIALSVVFRLARGSMLPSNHIRVLSTRVRCSKSSPMSRFLDKSDFSFVVRNAPLVSIDVIIMDPQEHALVGLRENEPAKGYYFVPGGAIRKNETIETAFGRIVFTETGLACSLKEANFVGVFEHIYETNAFGHSDYGTHYVVLAYELLLGQRPRVTHDSQHADFRWMSGSELLSAESVHPNTKAYFR
jgi:colanic acid biosynthesis protein WcaH